MPKELTITELRNMSAEDLQREIMGARQTLAALRLNVKLGKEKAIHLYRSGRKQLARMLTVLLELQRKETKATLTAPRR